MASVAGVELLETEGIDPEAVEARIEERREKLRAEVTRAEGKLSNEGFVAKAPADVVDAEREKLAALPGRARGAGRIAATRTRSSSRREPWAGSSGWSGCGGSAPCWGCRRTASPRSTWSAPTARPR